MCLNNTLFKGIQNKCLYRINNLQYFIAIKQNKTSSETVGLLQDVTKAVTNLLTSI